MKRLLILAVVLLGVAVSSAQTVTYRPTLLTLVGTSDGGATYTPFSGASGIGPVSYPPTYFVPMCSNTGSQPFSQCNFGGGGTVTSLTATLPVVATPSPITGVGVFSCPTCGVTGSPLSQFAATTSAQLAGIISDETGSGALVFGTSPTLVTPPRGTPTTGVIKNLTGTCTACTANSATSATTATNLSGSTNSGWYQSATNTTTGIALTNNGLVATNGSGVPAVVNTLPSGPLGTAQTWTVNQNFSQVTTGSGTVTNPGYAFTASTNSGIIWNAGLSSVAVDVAGTNDVDFRSGLIAQNVYTEANGSTSNGQGDSGAAFGIGHGSSGNSIGLFANGNISQYQLSAATSGANFNCPTSNWIGRYWNGSVSTRDIWSLSCALGAGTNPTSTLSISHTGSSGASIVDIPLNSTSGGSKICTASGTVTGCPVLSVSNSITSATGGAGTGTVTCLTATCTNLRGTYSVVGGTFTTGNFLALVWPTTTTAYVCEATMNGGTGFLGIGNDVATATGVNISAGVTILGVTVTVNYSCRP